MNMEAAHILTNLKSVAQQCKERSVKFYARLKRVVPELFQMFSDYTHTRSSSTKNADRRPSPFRFALWGNPDNIYSANHRTSADYTAFVAHHFKK